MQVAIHNVLEVRQHKINKGAVCYHIHLEPHSTLVSQHCIYLYVCALTQVYTNTSTYTYAHIHTLYIYVCVRIDIHIHISIYIYIYQRKQVVLIFCSSILVSFFPPNSYPVWIRYVFIVKSHFSTFNLA